MIARVWKGHYAVSRGSILCVVGKKTYVLNVRGETCDVALGARCTFGTQCLSLLQEHNALLGYSRAAADRVTAEVRACV